MLTGIAGLCLLLTLLLGPQLWTRHVFKRHDAPLAELPGTGGELARHLLARLKLTDFSVQALETAGDHYDPENKTVFLSPGVHEGKSLTAVVVAAHEVGHALQHFTGFKPLYLRWNLAKYIAFVEKAASIMLVSFPFVALLSKSPLAGGLMLLLGLATLLLPVVFTHHAAGGMGRQLQPGPAPVVRGGVSAQGRRTRDPPHPDGGGPDLCLGFPVQPAQLLPLDRLSAALGRRAWRPVCLRFSLPAFFCYHAFIPCSGRRLCRLGNNDK